MSHFTTPEEKLYYLSADHRCIKVCVTDTHTDAQGGKKTRKTGSAELVDSE